MVLFAFDISSCFGLVKGINGQSSTEENFRVFFFCLHMCESLRSRLVKVMQEKFVNRIYMNFLRL